MKLKLKINAKFCLKVLPTVCFIRKHSSLIPCCKSLHKNKTSPGECGPDVALLVRRSNTLNLLAEPSSEEI